MAWLPVSNVPIQYVNDSGVPYSGAVLKFYQAGTSTNIAVATEQDGTPTVTSVALNADGFPEVSGNVVMLFVDQDYKVALYPTQAAADSNTGANWTLDNIDPFAVLTLPTNLSEINALTPSDGTVIVGDGSDWVAETGNTARTSLGLGTGDSPQFTAVTISGLTTGRLVVSNSAGALTAIATNTKGSMAVGNGTTTAALAVGSNTQVLTANSGATNGVEWAAATVGIKLLSTATISSSSSVVFTSAIDSTYDEYEIHFINVVPATDGGILWIRCSTDGGSTYDSGASDYNYQINYAASAGSTTTAAQLVMSVGLSSGSSAPGFCGVVSMVTPASATRTMFYGNGSMFVTAGNISNILISGVFLSVTPVNAIQILADSGNLESGTIKLYGIIKS